MAASYFDVDGTLVTTNLVHPTLYYMLRQPTPLHSLKKLGKALVRAPLMAVAELQDRRLFNEMLFTSYEGMSEDRLLTLAEEAFIRVMKPALYPGAKDLVRSCLDRGHDVVLVSGALDFTMTPLARHLGADDLIANRMQFVGGKATGKVIPPIIEGANKADVIREYCEKHDISLMKSFAYSDSASDYAMLTAVGRPTAVNPDLRLRALARSYNWPVLDLR